MLELGQCLLQAPVVSGLYPEIPYPHPVEIQPVFSGVAVAYGCEHSLVEAGKRSRTACPALAEKLVYAKSAPFLYGRAFNPVNYYSAAAANNFAAFMICYHDLVLACRAYNRRLHLR